MGPTARQGKDGSYRMIIWYNFHMLIIKKKLKPWQNNRNTFDILNVGNICSRVMMLMDASGSMGYLPNPAKNTVGIMFQRISTPIYTFILICIKLDN